MHNPPHISPPNIILKESRDGIIRMRHFNKDIGLDYIDLYTVQNRKALENILHNTTCVGLCKCAGKGWGASFLVYLL